LVTICNRGHGLPTWTAARAAAGTRDGKDNIKTRLRQKGKFYSVNSKFHFVSEEKGTVQASRMLAEGKWTFHTTLPPVDIYKGHLLP
jgi:hypothetical protein